MINDIFVFLHGTVSGTIAPAVPVRMCIHKVTVPHFAKWYSACVPNNTSSVPVEFSAILCVYSQFRLYTFTFPLCIASQQDAHITLLRAMLELYDGIFFTIFDF